MADNPASLAAAVGRRLDFFGLHQAKQRYQEKGIHFMTLRTFFTGATLAALAALAGCQMVSSRPAPIAIQTTGVDGDWISTDGVAISRFVGGQFETIATDTGNKLAEGTYHYSDARTVAISLRSLIRQTTSNVNCAIATPTQLNCTSSDGNQFVLVRRTGIS